MNKILLIILSIILILIIIWTVWFVPNQYTINLNRKINKFKKKTKPTDYPQKIQKNIFQTYHTKILPDKLKQIVELLKAQNPEYKYYIYDDNDIDSFIKENYPEYYNSYKKINKRYSAARADFFRYMIIYQYGGVYFDIKSGATVPLREIIKENDEFVTSGWLPNIEKYINWCIIAEKGNKLLKIVLDEINNSIQNYDIKKDGFGQMGVLKLTGPLKYSKIIDKHKRKFKIKYFKNLDKSRLIYNYTFKNIFDNISCNMYAITKGKLGNCNHHVKKKNKKHYIELTEPIVLH